VQKRNATPMIIFNVPRHNNNNDETSDSSSIFSDTQDNSDNEEEILGDMELERNFSFAPKLTR